MKNLLVFALLILFLLGCRTQEFIFTQNQNSKIELVGEPDYPCQFGYRTAWYVVKDESPLSVIDKLNLNISVRSNWENGIKSVYENDYIFVSPNLDGYILVIGIIRATEDNNIVKGHAMLFDELQYFASHDTVSFYAWARFQNHHLIHAYNYSGERGEVCWNEGNLTVEELQLGFDKFPITDDDSFDDADSPDEESVLSIAKLWGIDPKFANDNYEKSTGYLCVFKDG